MTNQEIIAVVQAAEAGEQIQSRTFKANLEVDWVDDPNPNWNFRWREFRVKPKPLEMWVNVYQFGGHTDGYAYETEERARVASGDTCSALRIAIRMKEV